MATIRDVARLAGVSVATVSRVLNSPGIVTPDKRDLVMGAIQQLEFSPNRTARSLKSKNFQTIALVVTDISNIFFAEIASAVERLCDEYGYSVLLCNLNDREERLARFLREFPARGVDGVIICGAAYMESPIVFPLLQELTRIGLPLVFSGHEVAGIEVPTVTSDNVGAMQQIAHHLFERGRERVVYIGGPAHSAIARERLEAFQGALSSRGLSIDSELIRFVDNDFQSGHDAARELLAIGERPDAVVAGSDQIAIGAIRGARELGFSVPQDISVVGFDDTRLARFTEPTLTSVSVNVEQIGVLATRKLLDIIGGEAGGVGSTLIPCELKVRSSS